ncbi:MAG TPA: hypothetical protein VE090_06760 [Methylomirabilota bacterium]|nr:hypothetical protein [Methylomirabilota bacterium]
MARKTTRRVVTKEKRIFDASFINTIISLALIVILAIVFVQFLSVQVRWNKYQDFINRQTVNTTLGNSEEDGRMLATIFGTSPATTPLYEQPAELQKVVNQISRETGRDLVVVDNKKIILADAVPGNRSKAFTQDTDNEVKATIMDGSTRHFTEKSIDYPKGISQTVVPLLDGKGAIVGAVIISNSVIFK